MPSNWPPTFTAEADAAAARLPSPRWKKPSSGPLRLPRTGHGSQRSNLCPRGPMPSRAELKRRLRASAEAAALALAEAEAARGSHVDGGLEEMGPTGTDVDAGHGSVRGLWSGADEVALLAAAAAFRDRTGRAPRRPDAGELFDAIKGSVSPGIDAGEAFDRLDGFERKFLDGALGASDDDDPHGRRLRDLCAAVWGTAVDVAPPPVDNSGGEEAGEQDADEGRLVAEDDGVGDADDQQHRATEETPKTAPLPSPSAMDVDDVPALVPSPSKSMKHPQPAEPSADDGRPSRVPSLRRLDISTLAHAAAAAARWSENSASAGHVDGEHRNDVQSRGTAQTQRLEESAARDSRKAWSEADEVALLTAAAAFRERTGRAPRIREDAGTLLRSVRGAVSPHIDEAKASNKLRRFRSMFRHEAPGEDATAHDRRVHDLSAKVWGPGVVARDEKKGAVMLPVVREVLGEFWKVNERAMAGLPLDKGLSLLGKREARLIETKWRQQLDEEMKTQMQRHDLAKEICRLLSDTVMELDP
ncbi:hypothetical protein PR202_gb09961 [Eleusine coracana subsp. coracana]|uniref:Glabrous enhancer-binding protein-like DBD domain-containing protein n=1 Tax=Eleusine coracana subsp. coracana TaxID=191504 RepID=A0AAV5EJG6_ELECO|nr:hypothetical protein PR202_gb09961 [Eleusine coracana subsp. coracana]